MVDGLLDGIGDGLGDGVGDSLIDRVGYCLGIKSGGKIGDWIGSLSVFKCRIITRDKLGSKSGIISPYKIGGKQSNYQSYQVRPDFRGATRFDGSHPYLNISSPLTGED